MRLVFASLATSILLAAAAAWASLHSASAHPSEGAPATDAVPGLVWHSGTVTMRLTDQPCRVDDFARVLEVEGVVPPRTYVVHQGSREFSGCWSKDLGGDVITMEANRDLGSIPIAWFRVPADAAGPTLLSAWHDRSARAPS